MSLELRRKKELEEMRKQILERLDQRLFERIERRFGSFIPQERLEAVRQSKAEFLSAGDYERRVHALGGLPEGGEVVGDCANGRVHVNYEHREVPRTLVHERLHQLADKNFAAVCGQDLHEGFTERLAREVSPDLGLRDERMAYPQGQRVVDLFLARAGPEALAKAYFQGDLSELRARIDSELGAGALDQALERAREGDLEGAERLLRGESFFLHVR